MSLQGTLSQLGVAELLQSSIAGRQGNLYLHNGATRAVLHVDEHQLILVAPEAVDAAALLQGLVSRGTLDGDLVARERVDHAPLRALDELMKAGAIAPNVVDVILRGAAEDAVLDLLTWQSGEFRFRDGEARPDTSTLVSRVAVDLGGVLLRSAQRIDERLEIAERLGSASHLFVPVVNMPVPDDLEEDVVAMMGFLDGQRVVDEIALLGGLTRFATLRAVLAAVLAGMCRAPFPEELRSAAEARIDAGQHDVARDLLLQWSGLEPDNLEPLKRLVDLARSQRKPEDEADALLTLGQVLLHQGTPGDAVPTLQELVAKRPGDARALATLAQAAEEAGDFDLYARTTLGIAEAALEEDEPQRALQLMTRLVSVPDAPIQARVLRARAHIKLNNTDRFLQEAEAARLRLQASCRRKDERDAAAYFRGALVSVAPERTDLIRDFGAVGARRPNVRRGALVGALLCLLATAGVILWPDGPGTLLEQAHTAAAQGNRGEALRLISVLAEDHPDAPETMEAFILQAQLQPPRPTHTPRPKPVIPKDDDVGRAVAASAGALPGLPAADAIAALERLAALLGEREKANLRRKVVANLEDDIRKACERMVYEIRVRTDTLRYAATLAKEDNADAGTLRRLLRRAEGWRTDGYLEGVRASIKALDGLVDLHATDTATRALRTLAPAVERLGASLRTHAAALDVCRRRLTLLDVFSAHESCVANAGRHLVAGRFDEAEACYAELANHLQALQDDPVLTPLLAEVSRRRIPEFLSERRATLASIQSGLASARAAEEAGNLSDAVRAYRMLAERHWKVRFETVLNLPLRVESTPLGAEVLVNGEVAGTTPLVLRYPWSAQVMITVQADGFVPATHLIPAADRSPPHILSLHLAPKVAWEAPVDATVISPPILAADDLLVTGRGGRIVLHKSGDGQVRWARHLPDLEGTRGRAAYSAGLVYVPFLAGIVHVLDVRDGQPAAALPVGRVHGDAAALDDLVAVASTDMQLVVIRRLEVAFRATLPARATAGVVAAHGAFWVGTADGDLVAVGPDGRVRTVDLPDRRVAIVGIAAYARGMLVSRSDGSLFAVQTNGEILWRTRAVGDVVGAPAAAGDTAACVDSRGRVLLFDLASGSPQGQIALDGSVRHGLLGHGSRLILSLGDGRIWIHDTSTDHTLCDSAMAASDAFPLALLDGDRLAAPLAEGHFGVILLPPAR